MEEEQFITLSGERLVELQLLARNARLRQARSEKGFTQKDLSLVTGVPVVRIQQIENLRLIPHREVMDEFSSALEKPVNFLFPPELLEAIETGVFHERKAQLKAEQISTLTEAKRLGYRPALTSGIEEEELKKQIKEAISNLHPRTQRMITLRFGLDGEDKRTYKEIGQEFNVTGSRVMQIINEALRTLRHPARSKFFKDFLFD